MSIIRTQDLTKVFGGNIGKKPVTALNGLTMHVEAGEVFGFLGPNGAGKTTALKILTGLIRPTRGEAFLFEKPVRKSDARQNLGFMPESPYFYHYLTGRELLEFMGQLCGLTSKKLGMRVDELLELVGLTHAAGTQLRKYSKGMLQRIGIAQAIVHDPDLVMLDEPMTGLDPLGRRDVRNLIMRMRDERKTVFFSTHILADVEVVCDRVAILNKGTLVSLGTLADLLEHSHEYTEVAVRDATTDVTQAIAKIVGDENLTTVGHTVFAQVDDIPRLTELLGVTKAAGTAVASITPVRRSLEEVFVRLVQEQDA